MLLPLCLPNVSLVVEAPTPVLQLRVELIFSMDAFALQGMAVLPMLMLVFYALLVNGRVLKLI